MRRRTLAALPLVLATCNLAAQQPIPLGNASSHAAKALAVSYVSPEQVTVAAGKPVTVALHFRVAPGLHINSHTPTGEDLIPTTFKVSEESGVQLAGTAFPQGESLTFTADGTAVSSTNATGEKLSVYTGDFTVRAELVAPRGEHLVQGSLHYQACDNHACMPPHTIPVVFDVIAE